MGEQTAIEWTDHTWNPWIGCRKVSQGCKHCYMYRDQERYGNDPAQVRRTTPSTFNAPLKWQSGKVFTCSWSDFFIEDADPWRSQAWDMIKRTPHLTYQILTKRIERVRDCLPRDWGKGYPNAWIGTTVENQETADKRLPILLAIPTVCRFLSIEPLLGPIDLGRSAGCGYYCDPNVGHVDHSWWVDGLNTGIDWIIVGGESGPDARPMSPEWAENIRYQSHAGRVPFFFKQMGGTRKIGGTWGGNELHGHTYQEFPVVEAARHE